MRGLFFLAALVISGAGAAQARTCTPFNGHWVKTSPDVGFEGIVINYDESGTHLSIDYNVDGGIPFNESYIADSARHKGDGGNTGASYSADCWDTEISIVRYGLLANPLLTMLKFNGDQMQFMSDVIQNPTPHIQTFVRKVDP